jgi:hypothetical protein
MGSTIRYPGNVSIYEAVRTRPGAFARLERAGLTREHLDYRIGDAARLLGLPLERLTELIQPGHEPLD